MKKKFNDIGIEAISAILPKNSYQLHELFPKAPNELLLSLKKAVGIQTLHRLPDNDSIIDLALKTATDVLKSSLISADNIDALINIGLTKAQPLPTLAQKLHQQLNLKDDCIVFDYQHGCNGFSFALFQACLLIEANLANKVLIVLSESFSKNLAPEDYANQMLSSDGASAMIVSRVKNRFITVDLKNSAKNTKIAEYSGMASDNISINGLEIIDTIIQEIPLSMQSALITSNINLDKIDAFLFNQSNKMIYNFFEKKMNLNPSKYIETIDQYGNTGSPSIGIALCSQKFKNIKNKNNILIATLGIGASWGCVICNLTETKINEIQFY